APRAPGPDDRRPRAPRPAAPAAGPRDPAGGGAGCVHRAPPRPDLRAGEHHWHRVPDRLRRARPGRVGDALPVRDPRHVRRHPADRGGQPHLPAGAPARRVLAEAAVTPAAGGARRGSAVTLVVILAVWGAGARSGLLYQDVVPPLGEGVV